ncbi:hypothetical protein I4U23_015015 [Adineta vaga]|nr:hypothetical protein I4U23_015015 [Adineta vaga]
MPDTEKDMAGQSTSTDDSSIDTSSQLLLTEAAVEANTPSQTDGTATGRNIIEKIKTILQAVPTILVALFIYKVLSSYSKQSYFNPCNMTIASNRDFHKYYGIENSRNHFTITTADDCDSQIIINSVLPQAVLKQDHSATSFLILSKFGTGKTLLRCEYFKSLSPTQYFKVLILNQHLNDYLERYVSATSVDGVNCESSNCLVGWRKYEFGQVLLSMLVTQLVNEYEKEQFHVSDVSLEEKMKLISIICYYYNGDDINKLERFVNYFLEKPSSSQYKASTTVTQFIQRNVYYDKLLLAHFKKDLNKFRVLNKNNRKLELLLGIVEGEKFESQAAKTTMVENIFEDLVQLTVFVRDHVKKSVVFVIDGIDESPYLLHKSIDGKILLELFMRSSVCQEILSLMMTQNFYLSLFYPQIDDIQFQNDIVRKDKFPTLTIQWDTKSLMNYADYVIEEMNRNILRNRCQLIPDFETLVSYTNPQIADIINEFQTPRELHQFIRKLIVEMNNCAKDNDKPFIATFDNVNNAYIKAKEVFKKYPTLDKAEK